ncbi:hypothetical protein LOTGIDRAFT_238849 [Lottia gigantea]|uniref:PH domain-containing protein n=1 Tax=Lottia gigantea TaxID=225164 RepID=V4AZG7_LOTGI|nr:hypothetical protein LOTGIDRAFT_238849 [Lottia gigantea]ESO99121.1 hypothetical protein LOTGIDRAFT_238849 [Lottia gigantea]
MAKSSAADIRRTKSFSAQNLSRMSSDSESESTGSHTGIKIHKPMCVKTVAAKDITDSTLEGYLERRNYNGQWIRYWFILHSNCLYCYLTPDDTVTVDILDINNYHITALVDRFRGKPYVILLSHEEFLPLHLATETREELSTWIDYLQPESSQACPLDNYNIHGNNNNSANKVEYYKQKLLAEVLQQKHTIELERARRQKKLSASSFDLQPTHDGEDRIVEMTRLHQRRMSTQIKMDTLNKQLHANSAAKKPAGLFKFGKKKSVPKIELNPFLVDQIKALSVTMDKLNKDLADRTGDSNTRSKLANSYNNSKSMDLLPEPEKDLVHRSNSLKSSMQKLAHKTFIKASWTKRRKSRNNQSNSSLDSDESHGSFHSETDFVDLTKPHERSSSSDRLGVPSEWSLSSDSSFSLSHQSSSEHSPRSPRGENPMTFDIAFAKMKALEQVDEGRISPNVTNGNFKSSPRKEVDPAVLAEIEAFEEMAKDMMNRLTVTKT